MSGRSLSLALIVFGAGGVSQAVPYYSADFDLGIPAEFSGPGFAASVEGYAGMGIGGNTFSGLYLRNASFGSPTVLTLTGLPSHTSVDLGFIFASIDSWDGSPPLGCCNPDNFNVAIGDGSSTATIFSETFTVFGEHIWSYSGTASLLGNTIMGPEGPNLAVSEWPDGAYDMSLDPDFSGIPHTSSTLEILWWADGAGWQAGDDESFAIENVTIHLNGVEPPVVPEAGTTAAGAVMALVVAGVLWRRRCA